jgi:hypothetical protein
VDVRIDVLTRRREHIPDGDLVAAKKARAPRQLAGALLERRVVRLGLLRIRDPEVRCQHPVRDGFARAPRQPPRADTARLGARSGRACPLRGA